jgi:poly(3-hydroxybutyrate) depolymerase
LQQGPSSAVGGGATSSGTLIYASSIASESEFWAIPGAAVETSTLAMATGAVAVIAVAAGGAIAGIEIADGWSDGEVCNQVKKAAKKANLTPKYFLDKNKNYRVIQKYAVDKDGHPYVNADGTAVFAYETTHKLNNCPAPLETQLVPN